MSRIAEVVAALGEIAKMLPLTLLDKVDDAMRDAASLMAQLSQGSNQQELVEATGVFTWASGEVQELIRTVLAARTTLLTIANRLDSDTFGGTSHGNVPAPAELSRRQRIQQARQTLPSVLDPAQTQGRWLGPGRDLTVVRSGRGDPWYERVREFVAAAGTEVRGFVRLATHVEVKLAIRMREEGRTDETVVIDRRVCGRRPRDRHQAITCDRLLQWFLPEGAQLTIVEGDGTLVTYRGEADT